MLFCQLLFKLLTKEGLESIPFWSVQLSIQLTESCGYTPQLVIDHSGVHVVVYLN